MKITVYSAKGSAGKTPIATNIALDKGYALGTNEIYHVFDSFFPEEKLLPIEPCSLPTNTILINLRSCVDAYSKVMETL